MGALEKLREEIDGEQDADRRMVLVIRCRREQAALKAQLGNVNDIGKGLSIAIRFHPTSFMKPLSSAMLREIFS